MTAAGGEREQDFLQRFVFERARVRGELVHLDATWQEVLRRRKYPSGLRAPLGELMAGCALLAATVKLDDGALILQIQGGQPVELVVVECQPDLTMRATARFEGDLDWLGPHPPLRALAYGGRCALTIDPGSGKAAYQSVVPLEGATVSDVLNRYLVLSEQIDTRLVLAANDERAVGLLVQKLPDVGGTARPADEPALWAETAALVEAITPSALLEERPGDLLRRLFHGESLRLFEHMETRFGCRCSRERVKGVIRMVGDAEARAILDEQGSITATCEYCHEVYTFDRAAAEAILADPDVPVPPRG